MKTTGRSCSSLHAQGLYVQGLFLKDLGLITGFPTWASYLIFLRLSLPLWVSTSEAFVGITKIMLHALQDAWYTSVLHIGEVLLYHGQ